MEETPFSLEAGKWFAMQIIQQGYPMEAGNLFSPVWIVAVKPQKSGKGFLEVEYFSESSRNKAVLNVLWRKSFMVTSREQDTNRITIFSDITWKWLKDYCPQYFKDNQNPPADSDWHNLVFFLDSGFPIQIPHPEFESFRGTEVRFRYETGSTCRLVGINLPLTIHRDTFFHAYDEAAKRIKFYLPDLNLEKFPIRVDAAFDEDDVLTACALRFDGYKYAEVYQKRPPEIEIPEDPLDQLYMFFMLQRFLYKWGGEHEPQKGKTFRVFRELFLRVCRRPMPVEFIFRDYYRKWVENYEPFVDQVEAMVQRIHQSTQYTD